MELEIRRPLDGDLKLVVRHLGKLVGRAGSAEITREQQHLGGDRSEADALLRNRGSFHGTGQVMDLGGPKRFIGRPFTLGEAGIGNREAGAGSGEGNRRNAGGVHDGDFHPGCG